MAELAGVKARSTPLEYPSLVLHRPFFLTKLLILGFFQDLEEEVPFQPTSEQAIIALDLPCRFTEIALMILNGCPSLDWG